MLGKANGVVVYSPEFESFRVIGSSFPNDVSEVFESACRYQRHLRFYSQLKEEIPNLVFKFL